MEPFDEKRNKNVMAYQLKVHDAVCENCNKRRDAPKKAMTQIETASTHFRTAREQELARLKAERDAIRFDRSQIANGQFTSIAAVVAHDWL